MHVAVDAAYVAYLQRDGYTEESKQTKTVTKLRSPTNTGLCKNVPSTGSRPRYELRSTVELLAIITVIKHKIVHSETSMTTQYWRKYVSK